MKLWWRNKRKLTSKMYTPVLYLEESFTEQGCDKQNWRLFNKPQSLVFL